MSDVNSYISKYTKYILIYFLIMFIVNGILAIVQPLAFATMFGYVLLASPKLVPGVVFAFPFVGAILFGMSVILYFILQDMSKRYAMVFGLSGIVMNLVMLLLNFMIGFNLWGIFFIINLILSGYVYMDNK